MVEHGQRVEVAIENVAQGGTGVAHHDGLVLFVHGGLPGDRVLVEIVDAKPRYAHARAVKVITPSADRIAQECDHAGAECPGASWQIMRYEKQLEYKTQLLDEALRRLGRLEGFTLEAIQPAAQPSRARNHLQYTFGVDGKGNAILGLLDTGSAHRVIETRDCVLASERSNEVRNFVLEWTRRARLEPYERRINRGFLQRLHVREGTATGDLQIRLITSRGPFDSKEFAHAISTRFPNAALYWSQAVNMENTSLEQTDLLCGEEKLHDTIGDLNFKISPEAFFQTNTAMAEHLVTTAMEYADIKASDVVCDLYCGIGTMTLAAARHAKKAIGIELFGQAIEDAKSNAALNQISNISFEVNDVGAALRSMAGVPERPNVVIVDPPRAGLSNRTITHLLTLAAKRLVYVSCNPTTLAPDLRTLVAGGYQLRRVKPVDMFPQTPHIECVAELVRT